MYARDGVLRDFVPEGQIPFSADYSQFVPVSESFFRAKSKS